MGLIRNLEAASVAQARRKHHATARDQRDHLEQLVQLAEQQLAEQQRTNALLVQLGRELVAQRRSQP